MSIHILETIGPLEQLKRLISIGMEFALSKHKELCCGTPQTEAQLEMVMAGTIRPPWLRHLNSGKKEIISVYLVIKINDVDFLVILTIVKRYNHYQYFSQNRSIEVSQNMF